MVGAQINHSQIEDYAKRVAEILGETHFANQETINGQEILRLSEVKQINFFVLKNLFERWQQETRNLKSPFFNFKNEKVTKALIAFMNILSQNIEIEKTAFMPLLTTAVQDTLYLTLTPFDHFWADLSQGAETLSTKNLKAKGKYIKQNKHIYDVFIDNVLQAGEDKIEKADALNLLEGLIQDGNLEVEDNEAILGGLSQIHPLDIEAIYSLPESQEEVSEEEPLSDEDLLNDLFDEDTLVESEEPAKDPSIAIEPEVETNQELESDVMESLEEETETLVESEPEELTEELEGSAEAEVFEPEPAFEETKLLKKDEEESMSVIETEQEAPVSVQEPLEEESVQSIVDEDIASEEDEAPEPEDYTEVQNEPSEEEASAPKKLVRKSSEEDNDDISDGDESLNKKYSQEKKTINDQLKDDDKVTIADIHETQPTGKMQESISVNQRYMFINELFSGNAEQYNKAISDIERCESFDDSVELMIQKYAKTLDWNMNSPEVKELLKVIFKRYR